MSRPRIKLAHLVWFIIASGAVMGAFKTPTPLVASAVFTAMWLALAASVAFCLRTREPARTFWIGFVAFGWLYAALSFAPWFEEPIGAKLLTTRLLDAVAPEDPLSYTGSTIRLTPATASAGSSNTRSYGVAYTSAVLLSLR